MLTIILQFGAIFFVYALAWATRKVLDRPKIVVSLNEGNSKAGKYRQVLEISTSARKVWQENRCKKRAYYFFAFSLIQTI